MLVWNPIKKLTGVTTFAKIGFSQYLSIKIIILGNTWKYGNISFPPVKNIEDTNCVYHYIILYLSSVPFI